VTRIAIVAASEELRAALAAALSDSPAFEVVAVAESVAAVGSDSEVILVASGARSRSVSVGAADGDAVVGAGLTNRERQILSLLADGLVNKQIAERLGISVNTVKTHLELLFDKLEVATRAEAVATAVRRGLLLL
jgi:DNA-binding CsgD family transcriptional regulator